MLAKNLSDNAKTFIQLNNELNIEEKIILHERFIKNRTLVQVAKRFKVTNSAIKIKEDSAISKIDRAFDFLNL